MIDAADKRKETTATILERVMAEINAEKDRDWLIPNTHLTVDVIDKLRDMGYLVEDTTVAISRYGRRGAHKVSWAREYTAEELKLNCLIIK
jgi:hypothetical protein